MTKHSNISNLRKEYQLKALLEEDLHSDPIEQFNQWFGEAINANLTEPNAMCLSTVKDNKPHSRYVLLKGVENGCFLFYTNYESAKGLEIKNNPNVALNFIWLEIERQVRIEGIAEKLPEAESDAYFYSRPFGSQIGAIVSAQSTVIKDRKALDDAWAASEKRYQTEKPIRPIHWGGYRINPVKFEFWQGRNSRLHDRIQYELSNNEWKISRLSP